tara:strand:+ start:323 stop:703 length:381 start_codon:yes stop_codon:yes gene_type:complete
MKKYPLIALLVGVSLGRVEADSSKTDFYQLGIDAARENFKPKYSFALGAAMPNPIIYVLFNLISPVKVDERYNPILNDKDGKSFKRGYIIETKKLRLKESVTGSCYTVGAVGTYLIIALSNNGGIG